MSHPSLDTLRRFVLAGLPAREDRKVETHLSGEDGAGVCEICLFAARGLLPQAQFATEEGIRTFVDAVYRDDERPRKPRLPPAPGADDSEHLWDRLASQALRRRFLLDCEAALAPVLIDELRRRLPGARQEAIRTSRRYQLYGLAERLAEASRSAGFSDAASALELAELGVAVADTLDPRLYPPELVADRRALCRAFLGNARRVASDLFGADGSFQEALAMLPLGTGNELPRADLWSLLGSLRIDQARYAEARRLLEEALEVFDAWEEPENVGRTLLQLGLCAGYAGAAEEAVATFERAAAVLDPLGDDRLTLYARHNLVHWLVESGDPLEALARFEKARPLYDRLGNDPWIALRRRFLAGQIHAALGDLDNALAILEDVRAETDRRALAYEQAMVTLELAILHLDRGDLGTARELAAGLLPVFRSHELHRHALAALYLFDRATHRESAAATAGLAREVLRYLHRARNNPYLRFEPVEPGAERRGDHHAGSA